MNPPTTAAEAARAGYLVASKSYEGRLETARHLAHCKRTGRPAIIITPRKLYGKLTWDATELDPLPNTLSRSAALVALRAIKRHKARGQVGERFTTVEDVSLPVAYTLAADLAALAADLPPPPPPQKALRSTAFAWLDEARCPRPPVGKANTRWKAATADR